MVGLRVTAVLKGVLGTTQVQIVKMAVFAKRFNYFQLGCVVIPIVIASILIASVDITNSGHTFFNDAVYVYEETKFALRKERV